MFNKFRRKAAAQDAIVLPAFPEAVALAMAVRQARSPNPAAKPAPEPRLPVESVDDLSPQTQQHPSPPASVKLSAEINRTSEPGPRAPDPAAITTAVPAVSATEAAMLSLTIPQQQAIALLTAGKTRAAAAAAAGVSRMTLYRWLTEDPRFSAAFAAWQADVRATASAQLLAATHDAVATVTRAVRNGDAKLAWKLLESQGVTAATQNQPPPARDGSAPDAPRPRQDPTPPHRPQSDAFTAMMNSDRVNG
jgi:hypothetical protein